MLVTCTGKRRPDCLLGSIFSIPTSSQLKTTLMEQTFFQVYQNWLKLLSSILELAIMSGWNDHHECMMGECEFLLIVQAWKCHDRDLHTSFFNVPYILDVNIGTYIKGFGAWMTCRG